MKKYLPLTVFVILVLYISSLSIRAFSSLETQSALENRSLAKFPEFTKEEFISGQYNQKIENYLSDHIPNRNLFITLKSKIDDFKGKDMELMALDTRENTIKLVTEKNNKYQSATENVKILSYKNKIFSTFIFDEISINRFIKNINDISKEYNIKTHVEVIPTSISMEDYDFSKYSDPQDRALEYIYEKLDENIGKIKIFNSLYNMRDNYIYFRTDHHWTMRGSYIGASEFLKSLGIEIENIDSYSVENVDGFIGYQSKQYPIKSVTENPDNILVYTDENPENKNPGISIYYYEEDGNLKSYGASMLNLDEMHQIKSYGMFFNGDSPLITMKNPGSITDKKLLIIKDSFANIFVPWIYPYFSEIDMVDPRYFKGDIKDLLGNKDYSDILILININSISAKEYSDKFNNFVEN